MARSAGDGPPPWRQLGAALSIDVSEAWRGLLVRSHWGVENSAQHTLDTACAEDDRPWIEADPRRCRWSLSTAGTSSFVCGSRTSTASRRRSRRSPACPACVGDGHSASCRTPWSVRPRSGASAMDSGGARRDRGHARTRAPFAAQARPVRTIDTCNHTIELIHVTHTIDTCNSRVARSRGVASYILFSYTSWKGNCRANRDGTWRTQSRASRQRSPRAQHRRDPWSWANVGSRLRVSPQREGRKR